MWYVPFLINEPFENNPLNDKKMCKSVRDFNHLVIGSTRGIEHELLALYITKTQRENHGKNLVGPSSPCYLLLSKKSYRGSDSHPQSLNSSPNHGQYRSLT